MLSDYFHFRAEVIFLVSFLLWISFSSWNCHYLQGNSNFSSWLAVHNEFISSSGLQNLLCHELEWMITTPFGHISYSEFSSVQQWLLVYLNSDKRWKENPDFWKKRETLRKSLSKPITMTFPLPRQSCCERLWELPISAEICYPLCCLG